MAILAAWLGLIFIVLGCIAYYNGSMRLFRVTTRAKASVILSIGLFLFFTFGVIAIGLNNPASASTYSSESNSSSLQDDGTKKTPTKEEQWLHSILHCGM